MKTKPFDLGDAMVANNKGWFCPECGRHLVRGSVGWFCQWPHTKIISDEDLAEILRANAGDDDHQAKAWFHTVKAAKRANKSLLKEVGNGN